MNSIYVVGLGDIHAGVIETIEVCLWQTFGYEVRRLPPLGEPDYSLDAQRRQYSSVMILRSLIKHVPPDAMRILAVTEKDLFIPMLSFVFGQAQVNGPVAVVSLARLRQEFYGLPASPTLLLSRVLKEAVHEMGHTFGLTHCIDFTCPMSLSNSIDQVDRKTDELCKACLAMLAELTTHIRTGGATENL